MTRASSGENEIESADGGSCRATTRKRAAPHQRAGPARPTTGGPHVSPGEGDPSSLDATATTRYPLGVLRRQRLEIFGAVLGRAELPRRTCPAAGGLLDGLHATEARNELSSSLAPAAQVVVAQSGGGTCELASGHASRLESSVGVGDDRRPAAEAHGGGKRLGVLALADEALAAHRAVLQRQQGSRELADGLDAALGERQALVLELAVDLGGLVGADGSSDALALGGVGAADVAAGDELGGGLRAGVADRTVGHGPERIAEEGWMGRPLVRIFRIGSLPYVGTTNLRAVPRKDWGISKESNVDYS